MGHYTTNDQHKLHSDIVGALAKLVIAELMQHYGRSNSPAFKKLVADAAQKITKDFWHNHGREIEDKASEVIRNGAMRVGTTITVYENHIHAGVKQLAKDIWDAYH